MTSAPRKSEILVVRVTKLGETDAIVTGLTSEGTLVRGVVKGYRKPGSRLGGRLPLLARTRIDHTPGRSLDIVTDAQIVSHHSDLRSDPDRLAAAAVVVSAAERMASTDVPEGRVFALSDAALDAVEALPIPQLRGVVATFLIKLVAFFGYRPSVEICAQCGAVAEESTGFSCDAGGFLCPDCTGSSASGVIFCSDALGSWVDAALGVRFVDFESLEMPSQAAVDLLRFSKSWIEHFTGSRLKPLDFLLAGTLESDAFSDGADTEVVRTSDEVDE